MKVSVGSNYGLGETLLCPCCGEEYLHHDAVKVFSRREDDEFVRKTVVYENGNVASEKVFNKESGNPSGRRDGLSISFWCEICGGMTEDSGPNRTMWLHISQHKGNTVMQWEVIEK